MQYKDIGEGEFRVDSRILHHSAFNLDWINNPKVVIDAGAYDFGDSIRIKQRFPDCQVHGFELSKSTYERFSEFAESKGVITNNLGISNVCGFSTYYQSRHMSNVNAQSSLLEPTQIYKDNYSSIVRHEKSTDLAKLIRLDDYCYSKGITHIDLLHEDTEGFNYQVIDGLGEFRPTMIFTEFLLDGGWNGQKSFEETHKLLVDMGYKYEADLDYNRLYILDK